MKKIFYLLIRQKDEIFTTLIGFKTLSYITDRIIPEIKEWQNHPLESVYTVIWLDAMHFKVRDNGTVKTKTIYSFLKVACNGEKEAIGIYFGENESCTFWRSVLHELTLRMEKDIFVAFIDNLKGFADAIKDFFPKTDDEEPSLDGLL